MIDIAQVKNEIGREYCIPAHISFRYAQVRENILACSLFKHCKTLKNVCIVADCSYKLLRFPYAMVISQVYINAKSYLGMFISLQLMA
jgi:hypothetical protein